MKINKEDIAIINNSTNNLTNAVVVLANNNGFDAWRQNNLAPKNRKFIGRKGVADVIGLKIGTCEWLALEIKTGKDITTKHQYNFIGDIINNGGYAAIIRTYEDALRFFKIDYEYICNL